MDLNAYPPLHLFHVLPHFQTLHSRALLGWEMALGAQTFRL